MLESYLISSRRQGPAALRRKLQTDGLDASRYLISNCIPLTCAQHIWSRGRSVPVVEVVVELRVCFVLRHLAQPASGHKQSFDVAVADFGASANSA